MKRKILTLLLAFTAIFAFAGLTACKGGGGAPEHIDGEGEHIDGGGEQTEGGGEVGQMQSQIIITIGETNLSATLEDNGATRELVERLKTNPVRVDMSDYGGWEKVGDFGFNLPTSNVQITAQPCDFVLYQGDQLVIFYGSNSWSYTRLGKITGVTPTELKAILGDGDVTVILSLASAS